MIDVDGAMNSIDQVFTVEEQFRFSLAVQLLQRYGEEQVTVEWEAVDGNRTDIGVRTEDSIVPIELKYLTAKSRVRDHRFDQSFQIGGNHDANRSHYDNINDIKRLENVVAENGGYGYFILLSNIPNYWSEPSRNALHDEFRIYEGRTLEGELDWKDYRPWMESRNRDQPIDLDGKYQIEWSDFSYRDDIEVSGSPNFRYLAVQVD